MAYVAGTNGSEALNGTYGADYINALGGNDIIYGGYGSDNLDGGDGDDTFLVRGSEGPDFYTGGSGFDIIAVRNPDPAFSFIDLGISTLDSVEAIVNESNATVNIKTDYILDLSETTLVNINSIQGSEGNNYLTGNVIYNNALTEYRGIAIYGYGGNDEIIGSVAGDRLDGGNGNDTLIGGEGDDTLIGGAGADYFRFDANGGIDTVTDFVSGSDKIQLGPSITSVNLYNYNGNALLEFNVSSYAILSGVSPSAISSSDLVFV